MAYTYVQFISYEVNTFPAKKAGGYLYTKLHSTPSGDIAVPYYAADRAYLGDADAAKDIGNRCQLMAEAIAKAAERPQVSIASGCLKVFMAPEFYFRGNTGAYSLDDYHTIVARLRELVNRPNYRDWLFVFGTILATYDQLATETQGSGIDNAFRPGGGSMAGKKTALNIAFVQRGAGGEEQSLVVIKEVMSPIDFIPRLEQIRLASGAPAFFATTPTSGSLYDQDVDHLRAGKAGAAGWDRNQGSGKELQDEDWKRHSGLGIFKSGGITFGLEVCLDHGLGRLRASPPAKGQDWVQVQLVPSAGMMILDPSVIACQNGYVFNCDGGGPHSKVVKVKTAWKPGPVATEEIKPGFTIVDVHQGAPFTTSYQGKANLRIFPSKPIPLAMKVS